MKYILIIPVILILSQIISAQITYPDFWDNVIYFKINDNSSVVLPDYHKGDNPAETYSGFPEFAGWAEYYNVSEISRPFHTPSAKVKKMYRVRFDKAGEIDQFVRRISGLNYIEYAEKCPVYRISATPNDTDITGQYYLTNINAYDAWNIATGSKEIKLAIVDDACRITHPDLIGNIWRNYAETLGDSIDNDGNGYIDDFVGWDAADNDNNPNAPLNPPYLWGELAFTHGTHCAGLAGAVTNNITGIASVSHNVSIIPVKTVRNASFIPLAIETPAEGVDYAITVGADIVSMSFGGADSASFNTLAMLINEGDSLGVTFVAAAGNDGDSTINFPANFEHVISVGATTASDSIASFSQFGSWIDVMAPGAAMYSTLAWSSPYGLMDGTSMACPLTAGTLALMKSYRPWATPAQLEYCLKEGCDNIDSLNSAFVGLMGAGRINIYNSLQCLDQMEVPVNVLALLQVFPNPVTDIMNYRTNFKSKVTLEIYDLTGKKVFAFSDVQPEGSINIKELSAGLYVLTLSDGMYYAREKVSVEK